MRNDKGDINIGEIWKHTKTGGEYVILNFGKLQVKEKSLDNVECVIYQSVEDKNIWVRPVKDFMEIIDTRNNVQRFVKIK